MPIVSRQVWEFCAGAVIAFGTAIAAIGTWPTGYQWLVLLAGSAGAGIKAVNAYLAQPNA